MADEVWFMPAGDPWQKSGKVVASSKERVYLAELAIEGVHSWRVEPFEAERNEPTYTANTLQALSDLHPSNHFVFVIGTDQAANLTAWKYWKHLFDYARIGVVDRPQMGDKPIDKALSPYFDTDAIFRIPMPEVNIQATQIRRHFELLQGDNAELAENAAFRLSQALPKPVWEYLQSHPIYARPPA